MEVYMRPGKGSLQKERGDNKTCLSQAKQIQIVPGKGSGARRMDIKKVFQKPPREGTEP